MVRPETLVIYKISPHPTPTTTTPDQGKGQVLLSYLNLCFHVKVNATPSILIHLLPERYIIEFE